MSYQRMQVAVFHSRPHCSTTESIELKKGPASLTHHAGTDLHTHPHAHTHAPHSKPMQRSWLTVARVKRSNMDNWLIETHIKIKKKNCF